MAKTDKKIKDVEVKKDFNGKRYLTDKGKIKKPKQQFIILRSKASDDE